MNRFWKEMIGELKVEKRVSRNRVQYVVSKDGEYVMGYRTKSAAVKYAKSKLPSKLPRSVKQCKTDEERAALRVEQIRHREQARRDRNYKARQKRAKIRDDYYAKLAVERVARGLPPAPLDGPVEVAMNRYINAMQITHGPDWRPSTPKVFNALFE